MTAERWRITLSPHPDQDRDFPVTLDRMVFDVTIRDGRSPDAVAAMTQSMLHVTRSTRVASVEPIPDSEPVTAKQLRDGIVPGLPRDEVDRFLAAIGYFDEQETSQKD